jgi:hypothetical protein
VLNERAQHEPNNPEAHHVIAILLLERGAQELPGCRRRRRKHVRRVSMKSTRRLRSNPTTSRHSPIRTCFAVGSAPREGPGQAAAADQTGRPAP